jgi:hypothetical protein
VSRGRLHVATALLLACLTTFGPAASPAAGDGYLTIDPDAPGLPNCWPFGHAATGAGGWGPFLAFIYKDIPPFELKAGDTLAFDLTIANGHDIGMRIDMAPTTVNGGDIPGAFTTVASKTQLPSAPRGDSVAGNFELGGVAEAPFTFAGGGLVIRFSDPAASLETDTDCATGILLNGLATDTSGHFVKRAVNDPDGTAPWASETIDGIGAFRLRFAPIGRALSIKHVRSTNTFSGKISSVDSDCLIGHVVTVWRKRPGDDKLIGRDVTDASGAYSITPSKNRRGVFYATVAETAEGSTVCGRARSRKIVRS